MSTVVTKVQQVLGIKHLTVTKAGGVAGLGWLGAIAGTIFPSYAPALKVAVAGGSSVLAGSFLIANAVHALIASKVSAADLEGDVERFVDVKLHAKAPALVDQLVESKNIPATVEGQVVSVLKAGLATLGKPDVLSVAGVAGSTAPPAPAAPAVSAPAAPAVSAPAAPEAPAAS